MTWEETEIEMNKINWDAVLRGRRKTGRTHKCYYCEHGRPNTRDHIIPKARGNGRVPYAHKTMLGCSDCNSERGRLWLSEWAEKIEKEKKPNWKIKIKNINILYK